MTQIYNVNIMQFNKHIIFIEYKHNNVEEMKNKEAKYVVQSV